MAHFLQTFPYTEAQYPRFWVLFSMGPTGKQLLGLRKRCSLEFTPLILKHTCAVLQLQYSLLHNMFDSSVHVETVARLYQQHRQQKNNTADGSSPVDTYKVILATQGDNEEMAGFIFLIRPLRSSL